MKVGIFMPACCAHPMQSDAWLSVKAMSENTTPFCVLMNGYDAPLPSHIDGMKIGPYEDEADLWNWCLNEGHANGWDWTVVVHDDFQMLEAGWERRLEEADKYRVSTAAWGAHSGWEPHGRYGSPYYNDADRHLSVIIDTLAFGFRTDMFHERGCVTDARYGFGFAGWEISGWSLMQEHAIWMMRLGSQHHWIPNQNSRAQMHKGADGAFDITERYRDICLPSYVVDNEHIEIRGKRVRIAP